MLMKKITNTVSINPRKKTGYARAPIANEETTMLAESHCAFLLMHIPVWQRRRAYHCPNLGHAGIRTLIARHALDAPRLNTKPTYESLGFGIKGIADDQGLGGDCALISNIITVGFLGVWAGGFCLDIDVEFFRHFI